jgi:hypothetical protein
MDIKPAIPLKKTLIGASAIAIKTYNYTLAIVSTLGVAGCLSLVPGQYQKPALSALTIMAAIATVTGNNSHAEAILKQRLALGGSHTPASEPGPDPSIGGALVSLNSQELRLFSQVQSYVAAGGDLEIQSLPVVKQAIAAQAAMARPEMHEQARKLIEEQPVAEAIALPPIDMGQGARVLDLTWEAPV